MTLNPQQQAIIDWAVNGSGHANINALAGTGKTHTLLEMVHAIKAANPAAEIFLGAYNKSIGEELKQKIGTQYGRTVNAGTLHGAGYSALKSYLKLDLTVDEKKVQKCIDSLRADALSKVHGPEAEQFADKANLFETQASFIKQAVSLAKGAAFGVVHPVDQLEKWYEIIEHHGLDEDWTEAEMAHSALILTLCIETFNLSIQQCTKGLVDFDDMIFAPLFFRARFWPKTFVLVDEAQDLNPARRILAIRMAGANGRVVCVGDRNQAIYGFTGADSNAMDLVAEQLGSVEFPLTCTYRCPKSIVRVAQQWVSNYEAHPANPEGSVSSINLHGTPATPNTKEIPGFDSVVPTQSSAILCRNTKPLIEMAWSLIRRKIACKVEGREIGQGLISMAKKWKVVGLDAFAGKVLAWKIKEVQKFKARDRQDLIQGVEDRADTILCIIGGLQEEGKRAVSDFIAFVDDLFTETKGKTVLTLSTVHKSKGREWDTVYILGMNAYMPSRFATKAWQIKQEANLCYVSVTRSKKELVFVVV